MVTKLVGRRITNPDDLEFIMSLRQEQIDMRLLKSLFAASMKGDARFNVNDKFVLPVNKLGNKTELETTIGKYIFNLLVMYPVLIKFIGYINYPLDKGKVGDLDTEVADLLIDGKIQAQDQIDYIDKMNWLGYGANKFLVQALSYELFDPIDEVIAKRDELFEKHKEALASNNVAVASKIESQLVKMAEELADNRLGMELFKSGAAKKFGNNYKNMSILRGPIKDNATGDYNISKANLIEGIPKDEFHLYADLPVLGSHSRAIGTREGGYQKKILEASFQTEMIQEEGTDCGSKGLLTVNINSGNAKSFIYRYIKLDNGELLSLTPELLDKYMGKTVQMRSPMYCIGDKYCSKCVGDIFYKLEIDSPGLLTPRIGTKLLNASLKAFHDSTVKVKRLKLEDYIIEA